MARTTELHPIAGGDAQARLDVDLQIDRDGRGEGRSSVGEALRASREAFVAIWGQMGSHWGIPRSMAEIHALLFITGQPMNTDDIMAKLSISRGNASMTLRSLVEWGVVTRLHVKGDRKEYFQAEQDVWKMFRTILQERAKREVDPAVDALRKCRAMTQAALEAGAEGEAETESEANGASGPSNERPQALLEAQQRRLDAMLEVMEMLDGISRRLSSPSGVGLEKAARLLARLT